MTEDTEIGPALTAQEWKDWGAIPHAFMVMSREPQKAAALALHGQPFGFTWEDVDELHAAIDQLQGEFGGEADRELCSLADRIAALLPPR